MSEHDPKLKVVDADEIETYPISCEERLDSHYFVAWNVKRWRGSNFRRHGYADPEVGWFGMELFFLSQDETPLGTLPMDDDALAFLLRMPVARWRELRSRAVSPLHGWRMVYCDNQERRLAHPVVTAIATEALGAKKRNDAKNADDRMRKRLGAIAKHLTNSIPGGSIIAKSEERINQISDEIERMHPGGSATLNRIREAVNVVSMRD